MAQIIQASELLPTERAAIITATLVRGGTVTIAEVAELAQCTKRNAWALLCKISRVLPVANDNGLWFIVNE